MAEKIVIVDYGMGNLHSVKKVLEKLRANVEVSSEPNIVLKADKLILPGVGHFGKAMSNLKGLNLLDILNETVLIRKKPILGICLGMQLFAEKSEEGNSDGLGWIEGEVARFQVADNLKYKIPHIGWNQVVVKKDNPLMKNIPELSEFYFVHSYHLKTSSKIDILNESFYEDVFTSAVAKDNIYGVQYHPEKSHDVGAKLIRNFIDI